MSFDISSAPLRERLLDAFDEMVLYKDLSKGSIVSSFKLPSFMRDWVMKKFQDDEGYLDIEAASEYLASCAICSICSCSAAAMPTIPATFSVPARIPPSWPPPSSNGTR